MPFPSLRHVFLVFLVGLSLASRPRAHAADTPVQGAALLKTDILGVFAHPDDETGMAATLAHYAHGEHKVVAHAYVTRGEGGGNMVGTQAGPALGILREAELRDCLRVLGVRYAYFLDQEDFFYTESLAASLRKWRKDEALAKLVRLVRSLRPDVVLTMNPAPNPGQHGHHQAAGILATEAFDAAADPTRFPDQLRVEGLSTWQARKLFYGGASGPHVATIATTRALPDGRIPADVAGEALSHHRSQAFGGFLGSPWLRRPQSFTLARSAAPAESASQDLFDGLPLGDPVVVRPLAPSPEPPRLAFLPRPAIERFRAWAAEHGVTHLAASFPADLPVVAGRENVVELEARDDIPPSSILSRVPDLPPGWSSRWGPRPAPSPRAGYRRFPILVTPPEDAFADAEIRVDISGIGATPTNTATARLHPVPFARVPRSRQLPPLDAATDLPFSAARLEVGHLRAWQGSAANPDDCSAEVRLAHTSKELLVDVRVKDDVVVSNIAPDDIKGHWRSDSVEICVDPGNGAEDTTGCFKVGIFPFDSTGKVRAARDADARQGPVETTAPGFRVVSHRTPDGYRIRASIPWGLVTGSERPPRRVGFNVLIYDGDKADAAPGENINECRLAWAPRSGVQGRPEDWGRIQLD